MAQLNISQAAKTAGVARSTIQTHIKQGKLSAEVLGNGDKVIDTSELLRVYGELTTPDVVEQNGNSSHQTTPPNVQVLQEKVTLLQAQVVELQQDKTDLKAQISTKDDQILILLGQRQLESITNSRNRKWWRVWGR